MPFNIGPGEIIITLMIAAMVAVPILAVVFLARAATARRSFAPGPDPRVVLADRLARSLITNAEFDTAVRALGLVERTD